MRAELEWLDGSVPASVWALGCLRTALGQRFLGGTLLDVRAVRWAIALWLGYQAEGVLCNAVLVLSYKAPQLGLTALLTRCLQGEDYQSLPPLLSSTTYWTLAAWTVVSLLYIAGAVLLLRRVSQAAHLILVSSALNVALWLRELGEPLYVNAFSVSDHLWDSFFYGGTALLAWLCWMNGRARTVH